VEEVPQVRLLRGKSRWLLAHCLQVIFLGISNDYFSSSFCRIISINVIACKFSMWNN
jgi:hypothetical protein